MSKRCSAVDLRSLERNFSQAAERLSELGITDQPLDARKRALSADETGPPQQPKDCQENLYTAAAQAYLETLESGLGVV